MIPILTPFDVKAIDERALGKESLDAILERVGRAVAAEAIEMLGGTYGRRAVALAGPGLDGSDARATADQLRARGVRVAVVEVGTTGDLPACDLIIDGAFGIGLNRPWVAPDMGDTPVLSIDVPSGIDGLTGEALGSPIRATRTVTFIGLKQGLLLADGPAHSGEVRVVDIGLDAGPQRSGVVEDTDVADWLPTRRRNAHKWNNALLVVAGSAGMTGAATLATSAALRTGAGYVHLDTPAHEVPGLAIEVVASLAGAGVRADTDRFSAAVVGPGLTRTAAARQLASVVVSALQVPVVIDGDGLAAVADFPDLVADRPPEARAVLTPHDGEFERLCGSPPGPDRVSDVRKLAAELDSVLLLKGPTTIVADPDGRVCVSLTGDSRLATAGTGDVLSGIIGALLAQGVDAFDAAAAGAFIHGEASKAGHRRGLIASDLIDWIPTVIERLTA